MLNGDLTNGVYSLRVKAGTFPETGSRATRRQAVRDLLSKNLPRWDLDKDGKVQPREVDQFVSDPEIDGLDAATLATLKWSFKKFPDLSDGINASNLFCGKEHYGMDVLERFETYREGLDRSDALFEGGLPDPDSIKQGMRGSCALLSGLTVQARQDPGKLVDSVREESFGYRVAFSSFDEFVSKPTPTERLTGAWSNGIWATVFEKAMAQQNPKNLFPSGDVYDYLDRGLSPTEVIYELSGDETTEILSLGALPKPNQAALLAETALPFPALMMVAHEALSKGVEEGRVMMAASSRNPRTSDLSQGSHAYAITDYDSEKLEVTLRNPWGKQDLKGLKGVSEDDVDDGIFKASLEGFLNNFHTLSVGSEESDYYRGR